jgi:hypothetical protein
MASLGKLTESRIVNRKMMIMVTVIAVSVALTTSFVIPAFASPARMAPIPLTSSGAIPSNSTVTRYGQNAPKNFAEFFQNIQSMTVQYNFTDSGDSRVTSSETISFTSQSVASGDGGVAYKVNLTGSAVSATGVDNDSVLVWIDSASGSITQVFMDGNYWTGANAQKEAEILSFMSAAYLMPLLNSSDVAPISGEYSRMVSITGTQLYATGYVGLSSLTEYSNFGVVVGSIPQNGMQIVLSGHYDSPKCAVSYQVLSLVLN